MEIFVDATDEMNDKWSILIESDHEINLINDVHGMPIVSIIGSMISWTKQMQTIPIESSFTKPIKNPNIWCILLQLWAAVQLTCKTLFNTFHVF